MIEEPTNPPDASAVACPFVAFEDDRDHRSSSTDYRHRCFAAPEPEPRAFPHQERYCLSPNFAQCPIFLDWARQEAAAVKAAGPGAATQAPSAATVADDDDEDESAAAASAPAFLASARPRPVPTVDVPPASRRTADASATLWTYDSDTKRSPAPSAPLPPSSLAAPAVSMARRGPSYPGWENPPRLDSFPRLRSREDRRANQPLLLAAVGMALVMVTLVLFPIVMSPRSGIVGNGSQTLPSYSPSVSLGPSPTAAPRTSFFPYKVQSGDQMWAIAATFNIALQDLIAANPQIPNPDRLMVNAILNIPPVGWHATKPPASPKK